MVHYDCKLCKYETINKTNYDKHLETSKHIKNVKDDKSLKNKSYYEKKKDNKSDNKIDNTKKDPYQQDLSLQIKYLTEKIEKLEQTNNVNTDKIIREAKAVKKSLFTILNLNFKNNPSINYINENQFREELEKEYKVNIVDYECKLQLKILGDYENKYLNTVLTKLILKFLKKDDVKTQAVFNVDSTRGNYATKIDDIWHNDKSGLQLKKYTLDMIIKYILNVLDLFRLKLVEIRKENIKHATIKNSDYLMKYSTLLLEVNAYLTNPKTHKQIILQLCPELRMDQKLLEAIEHDQEEDL